MAFSFKKMNDDETLEILAFTALYLLSADLRRY
jgi:hypothetical protein